jgi:hypothetical protein
VASLPRTDNIRLPSRSSLEPHQRLFEDVFPLAAPQLQPQPRRTETTAKPSPTMERTPSDKTSAGEAKTKTKTKTQRGFFARVTETDRRPSPASRDEEVAGSLSGQAASARTAASRGLFGRLSISRPGSRQTADVQPAEEVSGAPEPQRERENALGLLIPELSDDESGEDSDVTVVPASPRVDQTATFDTPATPAMPTTPPRRAQEPVSSLRDLETPDLHSPIDVVISTPSGNAHDPSSPSLPPCTKGALRSNTGDDEPEATTDEEVSGTIDTLQVVDHRAQAMTWKRRAVHVDRKLEKAMAQNAALRAQNAQIRQSNERLIEELEGQDEKIREYEERIGEAEKDREEWRERYEDASARALRERTTTGAVLAESRGVRAARTREGRADLVEELRIEAAENQKRQDSSRRVISELQEQIQTLTAEHAEALATMQATSGAHKMERIQSDADALSAQIDSLVLQFNHLDDLVDAAVDWQNELTRTHNVIDSRDPGTLTTAQWHAFRDKERAGSDNLVAMKARLSEILDLLRHAQRDCSVLHRKVSGAPTPGTHTRIPAPIPSPQTGQPRTYTSSSSSAQTDAAAHLSTGTLDLDLLAAWTERLALFETVAARHVTAASRIAQLEAQARRLREDVVQAGIARDAAIDRAAGQGERAESAEREVQRLRRRATAEVHAHVGARWDVRGWVTGRRRTGAER